MDTSLKLQMDMKNNAEDLRTYLLELKSWEEEMKQKERELSREKSEVLVFPPPRNKVSSSLTTLKMTNTSHAEKKQKRIHAYDYSSWDKYDAEKACAEIDGGTSQEKSKVDPLDVIREKKGNEEIRCEKEEIIQNKDEAFYEKELGNQYVKKEKWELAINCYTRAITLDPHNAIYHANRALCFIKLKNFKAGEVDATIAIQLDKTYIKAYQRRAFARMALQQFREAKEDYEAVLKLEPNNALANVEINKLKKKLESTEIRTDEKKKSKPVFDPKIIFKSESVKPLPASANNESSNKLCKSVLGKERVSKESDSNEGTTIERIEHALFNNPDSSNGNIINIESKLKMESNAKIDKNSTINLSKENSTNDIFGEIPEGFSIIKPIYIPPHKRYKKPLRNITIKDVVSDSEIFDGFNNLSNNLCSFRDESEEKPKSKIVPVIQDEQLDVNNFNFPVPDTCLQFQSAWKFVRTSPQNTYHYLKKINPKNLPDIFKHSLESDLFSQLLLGLAQVEILNDPDFLYLFLYHLSYVHRFGPLIMFMSSADKKCLHKCISCLQSSISEDKLAELRKRGKNSINEHKIVTLNCRDNEMHKYRMYQKETELRSTVRAYNSISIVFI